MKISRIFKAAAVLSAAAVLVSAAGCADTSWSFKSKNKTLTAGEWIYYTYSAQSDAVSKIQEEDKDFDGKNFADKKIEKKNAIDWIMDEAKETVVAHMTMEKLIKDNKVKVDDSTISMYESQYSYYYEMAPDFYNKLGVSKESFLDINARYPALSQALFDYRYGEGGPEEVKTDELKKYFTDNYTQYYYISYSMTTTDEEGNKSDVDDDTKDDVTSNFAGYAKKLNEGATTDEIDELYKTDFSVDTAPSTSKYEILDDSTISDDLKKEIKALGEKKATVKQIDDNYYLIYKGSISELAKDLESDDDDAEVSRSTILHNMKNDDYKKYLEKEQKKLKYETNDACLSKYTVQRTIDIVSQDS